MDQKSLLFYGAFYQWSSHVKCVTEAYYHYSEGYGNKFGVTVRRLIMFTATIVFSAANATFRAN